jgi:predicted metal-dependent hydrolase
VSSQSQEIEIGGIAIEVVRKDIQNIHLRVYPPDGCVRVSAPHGLKDDAVGQFVTSRLDWIVRKQERIAKQDHQPRGELVTGEMHPVEGELYPLEVIARNGQAVVELSAGKLLLRAKPGTSRTRLQASLDRWYRRRLRAAIPPLIEKWQPIIGVEVAEWHIKKMKTRWGTCNREARRIWINLELAKRPAGQLEYIVVHEMVHMLERLHNARFKSLMDRFLPSWREQHAALKLISLAR